MRVKVSKISSEMLNNFLMIFKKFGNPAPRLGGWANNDFTPSTSTNIFLINTLIDTKRRYEIE
jgi:hypothetical protein